MTSPERLGAHGTTEAAINAPTYRSKPWWIPATIGAVAAVSAVQVTLEMWWLGGSPLESNSPTTVRFLVAHAIAAALAIALFTSIRAARGNQTGSLRYSERYLIGLGYGIATSLLTSVAAAALLAESAGQAVEYAGVLMSGSLFTLEMPVACIVGGLTWHLLTKVRGGVPVPARKRRPIEDPE